MEVGRWGRLVADGGLEGEGEGEGGGGDWGGVGENGGGP